MGEKFEQLLHWSPGSYSTFENGVIVTSFQRNSSKSHYEIPLYSTRVTTVKETTILGVGWIRNMKDSNILNLGLWIDKITLAHSEGIC